MKTFLKILTFVSLTFIFLNSCSKENDRTNLFTGTCIINGYAYIVDTTVSKSLNPYRKQTVHLNIGKDTLNYVFQTMTDSNGYFSIPYLTKGDNYMIFSHYITQGLYYSGNIQFKMDSTSQNICLYLYPLVKNEIILSFKDSLGGAIPRIPFSLFTSRLLAIKDSTKYAYVNAVSDSNGICRLINVLPMAGYYYVASKSTGLNIYTFDSLQYKGGVLSHMVVFHGL